MPRPQDLIQSTGLTFNPEAALLALSEIMSIFQLNENNRQINMVHSNPKMISPYDGTGTLFDFETSTWKQKESEFCYFAEEFKNSYFFEIFQKVSEQLNVRIGRTRLMWLGSKSCYSMHRDPTVRFHLPLITNDQAFLVFREGHIFHLPSRGELFRVDTRHHHTAMNGGMEPRIHFVLNQAE